MREDSEELTEAFRRLQSALDRMLLYVMVITLFALTGYVWVAVGLLVGGLVFGASLQWWIRRPLTKAEKMADAAERMLQSRDGQQAP